MSEDEAIATLADAGLELGGETFISQSDLPPGVDITIVEVGQVFIQAPAPGTRVPVGSLVSIAIRGE